MSAPKRIKKFATLSNAASNLGFKVITLSEKIFELEMTVDRQADRIEELESCLARCERKAKS